MDRNTLPVGEEKVLTYLESSYEIQDGKVIIDGMTLYQVEANFSRLNFNDCGNILSSLTLRKLIEFDPMVKGETFWDKLGFPI